MSSAALDSSVRISKMDDKYECGNRSFIFVISSPGAGKGTLSRWLAEDNDFTHISIGDMLREFGKGSGQMHKIIKGSVKHNYVLPTPWLFPILWDAICAVPDGRTIILDGFPRAWEQARSFGEMFADPALVILFDCSVAVAKERVGGGIDPEDFDTRYYKYVNDNQRILLEYIAVFPEHRGKLVEINADGDAATTYWILREALRSKPEWSALLDSSVSPPPSPSS